MNAKFMVLHPVVSIALSMDEIAVRDVPCHALNAFQLYVNYTQCDTDYDPKYDPCKRELV